MLCQDVKVEVPLAPWMRERPAVNSAARHPQERDVPSRNWPPSTARWAPQAQRQFHRA